MESVIADLKKQLIDQRMELATNIKNSEESLIRTKEGFLKVEGALEIISIIENIFCISSDISNFLIGDMI